MVEWIDLRITSRKLQPGMSWSPDANQKEKEVAAPQLEMEEMDESTQEMDQILTTPDGTSLWLWSWLSTEGNIHIHIHEWVCHVFLFSPN